MTIVRALIENPQYTLMRGVARFDLVRRSVAGVKRMVAARESLQHERELVADMGRTLFPDVNRADFLGQMHRYGCAFGLTLPPRIVNAISRYAESNPVFAFRDESLGFLPKERASAEVALGKDILIAQYFNSQRDCAAIQELTTDPLLQWVALNYLGSVPKFLGCNLWWTYPAKASREDRLKHAHFFHRDIDDFRFMKFFFYITDVASGDGAHWIVRGSHRKSPHIRFKDRFVTRRFEDSEIHGFYDRADILEVAAPKGMGFAEDTLCVHKAASPSQKPRLMLQLQYALFNLNVGNDGLELDRLRMIGGHRVPPVQA